MQVVNEQEASEVDRILERLLHISRVTAQVHPVYHEAVVTTVDKRGKERKRRKKLLTGDFVVSLFEGGVIPQDGTSPEARASECATITERLQALTRAALEVDRQRLPKLAAKAADVRSLKEARVLLSHLRNAARFRVRQLGDALVTEQGAEVRFTGEHAHERATKFQAAVNDYLSSITHGATKALHRRLTELLPKV